MNVEQMTIIGAGTMGTGIAQVAAQAGIEVQLIDTSREALERSRGMLDESLRGGIEREKLTEEQAAQARERITWTTSREPLREADWVTEAVFEDLEVKAEVLERAGEDAPQHAVIASNTSTLPISRLAEMSGRPERFIGTHFFNPAPAMKLVEVIPGERTLPEVTDAAVALCERMGKEARLAPDIPGFLVNCGFAALLSAAIDIWRQGAEPEDIDGAMELGLGHRMGPLATADLIGLDVCLALLQSLHEQTGHPRFEVPPELVEMVAAGKLGRKSGEGFHEYGR
ncbi:MAG: 3-hydroxyacyl-CoA dehydrogenase family protein [Armatimonadota bacterium]|nr:3-hydroxyacyl-CoA dehydrogenase family protein [Armatimonadota bacterium]